MSDVWPVKAKFFFRRCRQIWFSKFVEYACVPEWSKGLVSKTSIIHPGFESQAQVPIIPSIPFYARWSLYTTSGEIEMVAVHIKTALYIATWLRGYSARFIPEYSLVRFQLSLPKQVGSIDFY